MAWGQTTQVASHEELLARVAKQPLMKPTYRTADGKPLTEEQKAELEKSNQLMEKAEQQRSQADFAAAARSASEALAIRRRLFGIGHYLTTSSTVAASTLSQFAAASPQVREELAKADQQHARAQAELDKGHYDTAREAANRAVVSRQRVLSKDHVEIGQAMRILGTIQIEQRRLKEADDSLGRALEIIESTYGKDHPQTALVLDRVGWLRINQKKFDEATKALRRAVRIFRTTVGETPEAAESLDNLGTALAYVRDPTEALNAKLRSLVIRESTLGAQDAQTGVSLSNLAWLYARIGMREEAIPLRKRAITIFQKALEPDHPWVILEMANLAAFYRSEGMLEEAIALQEELVARDEKYPKKGDTGPIGRLMRLGMTYYDAKRPEDADRVLKKAVDQAVALHSAGETQGAIRALQMIANAYQRRRMYEDAVRVYELLRSWEPLSSGPPTAMAIKRWAQLGRLYINLGRLDEAKTLLEETVRQATKLHGEGALETAQPLMNLALALEKLGQLEEAERICEKVLQISEARLPPKARGNGRALTALGRIQLRQNRLVLAKFSLEEARQVFETQRNRRADPTGGIEALHALAECQSASGDRDAALDLLRQALDRCRKAQQKARNANTDALLAKTIWLMLKVLDNKTPNDQKEREALRGELKQLLEGLRQARALDVENKQWLEELEAKQPKASSS